MDYGFSHKFVNKTYMTVAMSFELLKTRELLSSFQRHDFIALTTSFSFPPSHSYCHCNKHIKTSYKRIHAHTHAN